MRLSNTGKTIFLTTGKTFTFYNVDHVIENEKSISFDYVSDGRKYRVVFFWSKVAGHSNFMIEVES